MKLVFASDFHLRNDQPVSRTDDFLQVQNDTLKFIAQICKQNNADLIVAGDVFNKAKQENMQFLINDLYDIFKKINIYFIAGNHDLLFHSIENFEKCNIGLLGKFDNWYWENNDNVDDFNNYFNFFNYDVEIKNTLENEKLTFCIMHRYCEIDNLPEYISDGITAKLLLEKYDYNYFIIGDNHKAFEYEKDGRFVFNTGCITRQSINEKDYKPSVILFDTEKKEYEKIYLPDNQQNVWKEEQITQQIKRENRIDGFINLIGADKSISLDYINNLKKHCQENKIEKEITNEIEIMLEEK